MKLERNLLIPSAGLLLGAAGLGALSQAKVAAKPAAKPAAEKPEIKNSASKKPSAWSFKFKGMQHKDATGESDFTEVVAVSDEGTTMNADQLHLNEQTKTA